MFNLGFKAPAPKQEEIMDLDKGVKREITAQGFIDFKKDEIIDGRNYSFTLTKAPEASQWSLSFTIDEGNFVTNAGLKAYKKVVDQIVDLVEVARKNNNIKEIAFNGFGQSISLDDINHFSKNISDLLETRPEALEGFSYEKKSKVEERKISIENDLVTVERIGKSFFGKKDASEHSYTKQKPLEEFSKDIHSLASLLEDPKLIQSIEEYVGAGFNFNTRNRSSRDADKLRTDLYERTLKQRFPECKFTREGDRIVVFLGPLNKGE